jgi:hypothetical protein
VVNEYHFPVVVFSDIDLILDRFRPLAPFVLKVDRSREGKVLKLVKGDRMLIAITVLVLNRLGVAQQEALKMTGAKLQEFKEALLEVPIMQDVAKKWEEKGIRDSILKVLQARFQSVPEEIKEKLGTVSLITDLDVLLEKAALSQNLHEFKKALEKLTKKE